tara:strand:+ start:110 stop:310 length:201 start_codon:yes stop_codon:yes gene_type:complete
MHLETGALDRVPSARKQKRPASLRAFGKDGAGTRSRTRDLLITSQLLYQLSYTGKPGAIIAIGVGE